METSKIKLDKETIVCALLGEMIQKISKTQSIDPALECAKRIHKIYTEKSAVEDEWVSVEPVKKLLDDSNERYEQLQKHLVEYTRDSDKPSALIAETKMQVIGLYVQRLEEILKPLPQPPSQTNKPE